MPDKSKMKLSRRGFLATTGAAAAGALLKPTRLLANSANGPRLGNLHPGVAAIVFDPDATTGTSGNLDIIRTMVDSGLKAITGESTAPDAMAHLLTEGTVGKKVAIKVNCINSGVPTRWEMVRAILERLVDAGIDPSNVTIFDNQNLPNSGYTAANFPNGTGEIFDGLQLLSNHGSCSYSVPGTTCSLSEYIVDADYLVNTPVLKGHWGVTDNDFHFTLGMKNHYGSISGLTHDWPQFREMLGCISADPVHVKPKTILVALSSLFGYYSFNSPGGSAENWTTFGNTHPKRVVLSTDPITADHIGQEMINHERPLHGLTEKTDTYVEYAATTFGIGIFDFDAMTVHQWIGQPPNLTVEPVVGTSRQLSWNRMNGAYGYRIYRSTNAYSGWAQVMEITDPSTLTWDESTSPPLSGYFYRLRAYNAFGMSDASNTVGIFPYQV